MSSIPLVALDAAPRPAQNAPPDPLQEFSRAAALKTAAGQQQIQQQQVQQNNMSLQQQQMQLHDEQLRRQLAPQYITKDDSGKPTGMDTDGLYNALLQNGADPLTIQKYRMQQAEMEKAMLGLSDEKLAHLDKVHDAMFSGIESVRQINQKTAPAPQSAAAPQVLGAAPAPQAMPQGGAPSAPVAGTGGMPQFMLPNTPQAQQAPAGAPESSPQEGAPLQPGPNARPISPEAQAAYHQELMNFARQGFPIGQMKPMLTDESDLDQAEAGLGLFKQVQANAKQSAETKQASAKADLDTAQAKAAGWKEIAGMGAFYNPETNELRTPAGQAMSPAMLEGRYVMNQTKKNAGHPLSPEEQAFDQGYEHMKTLVPAFNINMAAGGAGMIPGGAGAGGGSGSGGAPAAKQTIDAVPGPIKGTVQQILDYRGQMPPAGRNNPTNNAIRYWVNALDPAHDDTFYPARNKMMTAMTSGPEATQINAINTALGHVGVLDDAIDALHNSDGGVKALRELANKVGVQIGDTPVTTLKTIIHRVGPELTAAYVQGGGGEGERGTTAADFDPSLGNQQLKDNVAVTAKLLRSKIGSLENQYKNTMQRGDFEDRFMTPEARGTLNKLSPAGGGGSGGSNSSSQSFSVKAPNGKTYDFKDQASLDAFKQKAGIQ